MPLPGRDKLRLYQIGDGDGNGNGNGNGLEVHLPVGSAVALGELAEEGFVFSVRGETHDVDADSVVIPPVDRIEDAERLIVVQFSVSKVHEDPLTHVESLRHAHGRDQIPGHFRFRRGESLRQKLERAGFLCWRGSGRLDRRGKDGRTN